MKFILQIRTNLVTFFLVSLDDLRLIIKERDSTISSSFFYTASVCFSDFFVFMRSRVFFSLLLECLLLCFSHLLRTVSSEQPGEDLQVRLDIIFKEGQLRENNPSCESFKAWNNDVSLWARVKELVTEKNSNCLSQMSTSIDIARETRPKASSQVPSHDFKVLWKIKNQIM